MSKEKKSSLFKERDWIPIDVQTIGRIQTLAKASRSQLEAFVRVYMMGVRDGKKINKDK